MTTPTVPAAPAAPVPHRRHGLLLAVLATTISALAAPDVMARERAHAQGGTRSVERSRGADGAVDAQRTGRHGGTSSVDRYRDGSGNTDARITAGTAA